LECRPKPLVTLTPESRKGLSSVKSNGGNTSWRSVKDLRAIGYCKEVRGLRRVPFQLPISSGEIGVTGSNPTRVVGSCANLNFRNSGIGATSDFGVKSFKLPVRKIPKISGPLDQGRLTAIDPAKGKISKFGES
jgi:hypothetical protein